MYNSDLFYNKFYLKMQELEKNLLSRKINS